jgi:hypothetical protein
MLTIEEMGRVEEFFSKSLGEPIKFGGFVNVNSELQLKFVSVLPGTRTVPFVCTFSDSQEIVSGDPEFLILTQQQQCGG